MERQIIELLAETLEVDVIEITKDKSLEDLNWSSISLITFIALVDEKFQIILSPPALFKCKIVSDIVNCVLDAKANAQVVA